MFPFRLRRQLLRKWLCGALVGLIAAAASATPADAYSSPALSAGLDRIDQRQAPLDKVYNYHASGAGVTAYVLGSGINATHQDFGGRVKPGYTVINDGRGTADCGGIGTHVAGTIGGLKYGVAKNVNLVPVRVEDCIGNRVYDDVRRAIDWVTSNHSGPSVAVWENPSYLFNGHAPPQSVEDALARSVQAGVVWVMGAGDDNSNTCVKIPARLPSLITVSSTDGLDRRTHHANWGECVDLFAPGSNITSAHWTDNTREWTDSFGTLSAAAHVAGVAALYLEHDPGASPATIERRIINSATTGVVTDTSGAPNRLLYSADARVSAWAVWAQDPAVKIVSGDFNGDKKADIAMTGPAHWTSIPVAFSNGDGTFNVTNATGLFPYLARDPAAKVVTGDFNNDGRDDLAAVGPAHWTSIPVAYSNGDGTFSLVMSESTVFTLWASDPAAKVVAGDVNNDGRDDLMLTGPAHWTTIPVAFSTATTGTFTITNYPVPGDWPLWASDPAVKIVSGDFNGDKKADIAMTGPAHWTSIPVAASYGNGTFGISNAPVSIFPGYAADPKAELISGDFNKDGWTDLALTGSENWNYIPLAVSTGSGGFTPLFHQSATFLDWSAAQGAVPLSGDFDNDGYADIALTGGAGWFSLPVAFFRGGGVVQVTNHPIL
jgi:hypothetical protein